MKTIQYIAYTALCSLLLVGTGCSEEELIKHSGSSTFTIQITGEGSASVLTRAEAKVTIPLHLFIYAAGAADNVAPVFYKKDELTTAEAKAIKGSFSSDLLAGNYDIYVVGSPDADATGISATTTKSQLLALTQTGIADITSATKPYMLAGVTQGTTLDSSPTVQIVRNVCRLDLTLTDASGYAFTAIEATLSAPDKTFLFSSTQRGAGLDNTFPSGTQNTDQTLTLTKDLATGNFADSVFFFEKMTTAAGVLSEADRVKLAIKATTAAGGEYNYVTYLNTDANYTTKRNTIYEVNGKLKDGAITIETNVLPWDAVVSSEEKPSPTVTQPKANTYLVAPGSIAISIPVAQATTPIADGAVMKAELVWTDVKGATSGKGLASDAAVAAIEVIGTGSKAVLMVTPGSQLGNAVIAVKNDANVIIWSWHIWVTNYDPEQETGQNTSGGYIFMDRNLGAKSTTPSATGVDVIGNYYQFGRKDPFPTKSNTTGFVPTYKADGAIVVDIAGATTSADNQIKNPYLWGNATGYPADLELWGESGNKTVNDPCPAGWRVPSSNAYVDLTHALLPVTAAAGRQGAHTGFYPYTWFKEPNKTFNNMKLVVNWTSTPSGATNGIFLRADDAASVVGNYPYGRPYGHAVRCVRDWKKGKFEKEVRVLSAGQYSVSKAHQLGTHVVNPGWSSGIVYLLNQNFGKGDPVDVFFKHYNYYKGGAGVDGQDYEIIDLLATHEIDVLYLPWNGDATSPTADQSKKIVGWLDADPNRVLIVATEFKAQHDMLMAELGFVAHDYTQESINSVLAGGVSEFYGTITNGVYGKLAATGFTNILGNGYMPRTEIEKNGYVPILTRVNDQSKVTMSINPTRRVLLIGDTNWFDPGNALGGTGALDYKPNGEYSLLFANTWAWIAETVKGK